MMHFPGHVGHPGRELIWQEFQPVQCSSPSWSMILHVGRSRTPIKHTEFPELCFYRHHGLQRNQRRWRMATADTQIIAEGSMSSIWCGHHLTWSDTLDFPCRIAGRTRHVIALVCNVLPVQLNRRRRSMHCSVRCRLVTVQNQISFHDVSKVLHCVRGFSLT